MFMNYGDYDFFENGVLIDTEHTYEPENGRRELTMLRCMPYDDNENRYMFGELYIDIDDSWIDRPAVMSFLGMTEETFDPIQFAIGLTDWYSWDNFGAELYDADWQDVDRDYIEDFLRHRLIAIDNLKITW